MPSLHEIIAQIQRELYCPVCGKNFQIGEIRLKGIFDQTLIIQTVCSNSHMTLFMTTFKGQSQIKQPISHNDVLDLHNFLKKFDGDFQKIWQR